MGTNNGGLEEEICANFTCIGVIYVLGEMTLCLYHHRFLTCKDYKIECDWLTKLNCLQNE